MIVNKKGNTNTIRALMGTMCAVSLCVFFFCSCAVQGTLSGSKNTVGDSGLGTVLARDDAAALPFTDEVVKGRIDNGLTYLIRKNSYPQGRIQMFLVVKSGSLQEGDDQRGLAHFLEHMAFNGTAAFPKGDMVAFLQGLGMRFGPEVNAYTSFDRTVYSIEIPTDKADAFDRGLAILNDWARNITLDPVAVDDERTIINEEWRMRQGAGDRLQKEQLPVILEGSRHVERMPIGLPDVFMKAGADLLKRYYRDWYRPERMAVVLVGDLDPVAAQARVRTVFGGAFTNNSLPAEPDATVPPPQKGRFAYVASTDKELTYTSLQLMYKLPAKPVNQRAQYREGIMWAMAGNILNARLQKDISKPDCPYVYSAVGVGRYVADARFLSFTLVPKDGREADALKALFVLKASVEKYGFTDEEWDLEEKSFLTYFDQALQQKSDTESRQLAEELVRHFTEAEVVPGIVWEHDEMYTLAGLATAVQGTTLVRQAWNGDDLTFVFSQPQGRQNPFGDRESTAKLVDTFKTVTPPEPEQQRAAQVLLQEKPVPGSILKETPLPALGMYKWELSNGMVVYVKATDFKKDEIVFSAAAPGGLSRASDGEFASARHAANLSAWSGLGNLDRAGLEKVLKGRTMGVNLHVGDFSSVLEGSASEQDLEGLFELLYLNFTGLRMDPDATAACLESVRTMVANQEKDPEQYFGQTINYLVNGSSQRFAPLSESDIGLVQTNTALAFLKRIMEPGTWVFGFSGAMDLEVLKGLVSKYLASIPVVSTKESGWRYPEIKRPSGLDITINKGSAPKGIGYQTWYLDKQYSYGGLIRARVFNELLDIMLLNRIREEKGAVYSIGAGVGYYSLPKEELYMGIDFGSDPGRNLEVRDEIGRILADMAAGSIAMDDLSKAREIIRESYKADFRKNSTWARTLPQLVAIRHQAEDVFLEWEKHLDALVVDDIKALAGLFLAKAGNSFRLEPEKP